MIFSPILKGVLADNLGVENVRVRGNEKYAARPMVERDAILQVKSILKRSKVISQVAKRILNTKLHTEKKSRPDPE